MDFKIDRRTLLQAGTALAAAHAIPVWAQAKPTLRFSAVFSDKDIRADMIKMFAKDIEADYTLEAFYGATCSSGTELVAATRQPGWATSRRASETGSGPVDRRRPTIPRRQSFERVLHERSRRGMEEDGRRPAQG
jgi:hypothetical protein